MKEGGINAVQQKILIENRCSSDAKKKKRHSSKLLATQMPLQKMAATYSPTVTQYHRRDWA